MMRRRPPPAADRRLVPATCAPRLDEGVEIATDVRERQGLEEPDGEPACGELGEGELDFDG